MTNEQKKESTNPTGKIEVWDTDTVLDIDTPKPKYTY
jgi:hypothetical protein